MDKIINILLQAAAILVVMTVHEFAKAFTSTMLGDKIPKSEGRLTLNPIKAFEPVGFLLLFFFNFGWSNPVRTSSMYYKNRKRDTVITYAVPIAVNLVLGIMAVTVAQIFKNSLLAEIYRFILILGISSLRLGVCNIIPIAPFCGERILSSLLPTEKSMRFVQMQNILQMIMLMALFFGITQAITESAVNFLLFISSYTALLAGKF